MVQETERGLVYPEEFDHTRVWEHFEALAISIDAALAKVPDSLWGGTRRPRIEFGTVTCPEATDTNSVTAALEFPRPFTATPSVVVTSTNQVAGWFHAVRSVSPTSCTVYGTRKDSGPGSASAVDLFWIAIGT